MTPRRLTQWIPRSPRIMERTTLRMGSLRVRIRTLTGNGPRVFVLVHGIGVCSAYFEPLAQRLHAAGDVLLLDLPGFGGLPQPSNPLSITGFAHTVAAVMRTQGVRDPVLVGHSMGGQVVTELAARTDTQAPVVLIGPPVNDAEPRLGQQMLRFAQNAIRESTRMSLVALRSYTQCGPAWFAEVLPGMLRYPIAERIARVDGPVLLVHGEHDPIAPAEWMHRLAGRCERADVVEVAGAAHGVVLDHAEEAAALILRHAEGR